MPVSPPAFCQHIPNQTSIPKMGLSSYPTASAPNVHPYASSRLRIITPVRDQNSSASRYYSPASNDADEQLSRGSDYNFWQQTPGRGLNQFDVKDHIINNFNFQNSNQTCLIVHNCNEIIIYVDRNIVIKSRFSKWIWQVCHPSSSCPVAEWSLPIWPKNSVKSWIAYNYQLSVNLP